MGGGLLRQSHRRDVAILGFPPRSIMKNFLGGPDNSVSGSRSDKGFSLYVTFEEKRQIKNE